MFTDNEHSLLVANKIIPASATKEQAAYFFEVCKRKKLDPFLKQIHMIERKSKNTHGEWETSYTIQASIDGMRAIAQRNCKITSYKRWTNRKGERLYGCCEIATSDRGLYSDEVSFEEYVQKTRDGEITRFWKQFPETMIKKVAEESVLRMLAPEDLSGMYGDDEMDQASNHTLTAVDTKQIPEILDSSFPDEIKEPLPQTQSQGASFNQFDPKSEIMTFGKKHNGVEWINVPTNYLEWMSENASGVNKEKAIATLEFKKQIAAQVSDPLDTAFGEKQTNVPANDLTLIEKLQYNLEDVARKEGTVEALEGWKGVNQLEIDKLNATEKAMLKRIYTNAIKQAREKQ